MKTHEAEAILKYCADIPRRLTIIRRRKLCPLGAEKQTRLPGNVEKLARNYPVGCAACRVL